ncbi:MAG TPA: hypothetical protein EYP80_01565 [Candidatus Aenigmarchaeota archaeon]|nr:hypothetical protein [Candidatus Aenigmarchaeota archaeon]
MEKDFWKIKLLTLDKRIKHFIEGYRQNIVLLGSDEEEISFLLKDYFQYNKFQELIYIYVNSFYTDAYDFFKRCVTSLLSEYLNRVEELNVLINYANDSLRDTVNFIKNILRKNNISFLDTLEMINKFINETNKRCLFIIEEFLNLETLYSNFFKDFSKFIIFQRKCMIVLTSSNKYAEKVLSTDLNLLFGNFERIYLDDVEFFSQYNYLKTLVSPLTPSSFFFAFFIDYSGSFNFVNGRNG